MEITRELYNDIVRVEAMALSLQKEAARLRQKLQRSGKASATPKGEKRISKAVQKRNERIIKKSSQS
jgi:hypothetical protein